MGNLVQMDSLWPLILFLLLLAGIVGIASISSADDHTLKTSWQLFVEQNKLGLIANLIEGNSPQIVGLYGGRTLCLRLDRRLITWAMRSQPEVYTQAIVNIANDRKITLDCAYPGTLFVVDPMMKALNRPDIIRSGDQYFDSLYSFKGTPRESIAKLVQSAKLRSYLLSLKPTNFNIPIVKISGNTLIFERDEIVRSTEQLTQLADHACALATLIEEEWGNCASASQ